MLIERSPNQRASRVAIAGSIYMRRASLEAISSHQLKQSPSVRAPSYGKIVKNGRRMEGRNSNYQPQRFTKTVHPLQLKNILLQEVVGYQRKTPTPSFNHFDNFDSYKIKSIQDKYRSMLQDYESKKKEISSELSTLKSNTQQERDASLKTYARDISNIGKENQGSKSIIKQYETKSKQLLVQKLSTQTTRKKIKSMELFPKFFRALKNQILLEQELRGIKVQISSEKKLKIQQILNLNKELNFPANALQLDQQQFDPFSIEKSSCLSTEAMASKFIQKYKECQLNWKEQVCYLPIQDAKQIFASLNFEKTQQVSLKSFVRELSFLLQKHLRNRDLLKIYNRLIPFTEDNFCRVTHPQL